jgi:predicted RNase H-like HicB family nuclease
MKKNDYRCFIYKVYETDGTEQYICDFPDLKGCIGVGDTYEEAFNDGQINKELWIKTALEIGRELPIPKF